MKKIITVKYDPVMDDKGSYMGNPARSENKIMYRRIQNLENLLAKREQEITMLRQIILSNPSKDHWAVPG